MSRDVAQRDATLVFLGVDGKDVVRMIANVASVADKTLRQRSEEIAAGERVGLEFLVALVDKFSHRVRVAEFGRGKSYREFVGHEASFFKANRYQKYFRIRALTHFVSFDFDQVCCCLFKYEIL